MSCLAKEGLIFEGGTECWPGWKLFHHYFIVDSPLEAGGAKAYPVLDIVPSLYLQSALTQHTPRKGGCILDLPCPMSIIPLFCNYLFLFSSSELFSEWAVMMTFHLFVHPCVNPEPQLFVLHIPGLGGSVGCAVRLETRGSQVQPPPRSVTFFRGDWSWNIFYGHSLPSADSRRAVVNFWWKNVHNTG